MTNAERQEKILERANECCLFRGHGHYVLLKEIGKLLLEEIVEHNKDCNHSTPLDIIRAVEQALSDSPPAQLVV